MQPLTRSEQSGFLKAVKEFKEVLEQKFLGEPEPVQKITTLFGPGPIPSPPRNDQARFPPPPRRYRWHNLIE
jgi:hypothetical protein